MASYRGRSDDELFEMGMGSEGPISNNKDDDDGFIEEEEYMMEEAEEAVSDDEIALAEESDKDTELDELIYAEADGSDVEGEEEKLIAHTEIDEEEDDDPYVTAQDDEDDDGAEEQDPELIDLAVASLARIPVKSVNPFTTYYLIGRLHGFLPADAIADHVQSADELFMDHSFIIQPAYLLKLLHLRWRLWKVRPCPEFFTAFEQRMVVAVPRINLAEAVALVQTIEAFSPDYRPSAKFLAAIESRLLNHRTPIPARLLLYFIQYFASNPQFSIDPRFVELTSNTCRRAAIPYRNLNELLVSAVPFSASPPSRLS